MTDTAQAAAAQPATPAPMTVASAVAARQPVSHADAVSALRNSRAATNDTGAKPDPARTDAPKGNPYSDAARKLNEARRAKTAQPGDDQGAAQVQEDGGTVEDDPPQGETLSEETANGEQPNEAETHQEHDEGADTPKIKLAEGVEVTLDEVRDGIMMKADHTRKTQALAQDRTQFEADRSQRLQLLDTGLSALQDMIGKTYSLREHLTADPVNGAMNYAIQQENVDRFHLLNRTRAEEQTHHDRQNRANAINALKEAHGDKAEGHYNDAVDYASSLLGMDKGYLGSMMAHPAIIEVVRDAKAYRALQANKGNITKTLAEKPKVVRPGARVSPQSQGQRSIQNAKASLTKSGNLADAVALLRTLRNAGGMQSNRNK